MFRLWKRIKKAMKNYSEKMAKENEKLFGSGNPQCLCKQMSEENRRKV